ncbi:MAG: PEP-CTERM sorting domain-containing protein [Bryobacteraceae bacterium]
MKLALGLSLALLGALSSAHAAPVKYNIQFTTTSGSPTPASGSFFYDPDVPVFSGFVVVWNGISFNMTAAANNPSALGTCNTAGNGAADTFDFLLNQNCGSGQYSNGWSGSASEFATRFKFERSDNGSFATNAIAFSANGPSPDNSNLAEGTFSIRLAEAPVPEPATLSLLTAAAALLAVRLRVRRPS